MGNDYEHTPADDFTRRLLAWLKEQELTIDDTRLVKKQAIDMLHKANPQYTGQFCLDVQYYAGGAYSIIPRDLATGLALCSELPPFPTLEDPYNFNGKHGRYEYTGKNFIFRSYLKPLEVSVDMSIRTSG